jgi:hypothetical protein
VNQATFGESEDNLHIATTQFEDAVNEFNLKYIYKKIFSAKNYARCKIQAKNNIMK